MTRKPAKGKTPNKRPTAAAKRQAAYRQKKADQKLQLAELLEEIISHAKDTSDITLLDLAHRAKALAQ